MAVTYKDWHEVLPFTWLRYRALVHISTGATPLLPSVYNMEVVPPVEVEFPTIGVLLESQLD